MADVGEEADLGDEVVDHDEEHDDDDADDHQRVWEKREGAARGVDLGGDVEAAECEGVVRGATGEEHLEIWVCEDEKDRQRQTSKKMTNFFSKNKNWISVEDEIAFLLIFKNIENQNIFKLEYLYLSFFCNIKVLKS